MIFFFQREQIKKQIIQNLKEAGDTVDDNSSDFQKVLDVLDPKDLLAVLLESYQLKEQKQASSSANAHYIDFLRKSNN